MYVPGSDEKKLGKIPAIGADSICLDCEDGVAFNKKHDARTNIRRILDNDDEVDFGRSECSVRVNSVSSGLTEDDIKHILSGCRNLPRTLYLPKVDEPAELREFVRLLEEHVEVKGRPPMALIIFIESARSLLNIKDILQTARDLKGRLIAAEGLVFGSDDFVADIGATRTASAGELLYARQKLITAAKAFELQAIDLVHIDYKDLDGLKAQSEEGFRMGFTGKQVIHPGQVGVVQRAFSPSEEKIKWAQELIAEFRRHEQSGKGAFNFRGSMIDMPLVKQAQNIVNFKDYI